jgi:hypothetical protein
MYVGAEFSPAEQIESDVYGLDFVNDLDEGETLVSAAWYLTVVQGTDPTPNSHLVGVAELVTPEGTSAQTATQQRISGLLPDVTYAVQAVVTTSEGNTKALFSHIQGVDVE